MKKLFTFFTVLLFGTLIYGQTVIDNFDNSAEGVYDLSLESSPSSMILSTNTVDKVEGTGALDVNTVIGSFHPWGSYAQLIYRTDSTDVLDWTLNDTLSIWIKVKTPPAHPEYMVFRIHIADRPSEDAPLEEYIYENISVLDYQSEWFNLKIPLVEREQPGADIPDSTGFILAPTSWGGFTYNNRVLDRNKIIGYNIGIITSGYDPNANLPADSIVVSFDNFERTGVRSIPLIIFNGMVLPTGISSFSWGQSTLAVEEGAGATTGTNALKWVQGNEWGNGWTGMGFNLPVSNLAGSWQQDSVKFKMKAEDGVGNLRVQFEAGAGKVGTVFTPIADNQWHSYSLPLREMTFQDGSTFFDSSAITVVGMMAEASGIAGKVIYIDDWWTGNPEFDVVPPIAPVNIAGIPGDFVNLVTWADVPGEDGEVYNIYYSASPITDVSTAEVVRLNMAEGLQVVEHILRAPVTDQQVTYYYAVVCVDKAGNIGAASESTGGVTNTAKGVPTVSLNAPSSFAADGNLGEWAAVTPITLSVENGTAYVAPNTVITNDADLMVKAYVAMNNDYLYVAFDIEDDVISFNPSLASYLNDCADLFLGLFDWRGKPHTSYQRGAQPDYHFRFAKDKAIIDGLTGGDSLLVPGAEYYWGEKFPTGYVIEARIAFAELASRFGDNLFVPAEGFRLPIDFSINDADATGEREGILTYSIYNEDQSWNNPSRWTHTWIGSLWEPVVGIDDDELLPDVYSLSQNYPNPFNPTTLIKYSIQSAGFVSIKIFDVLGREVSTLVNQNQNPGEYTIQFNGSGLSSGIYFYQIESGSFHNVKKMMLVK
jgi:hypothetical protein